MDQNLPVDGSNRPVQLLPARVALARTVDATISSSTEVTFHASTSIIRVYATDADVYMKWGTTDVDATNFDQVIPAGQIADFVVPSDTSGNRYAAANFIERVATAALIVLEF